MIDNKTEEISNFANIISSIFEIEIPITLDSMKEVVKRLKGEIICKHVSSSSSYKETIVKKHKEGFIIELPRLTEQEEQCAIAYGLGHLFINMGYCLDEELWRKYNEGDCCKDNLGRSNLVYEFALTLLMPREKYSKKAIECYVGDGYYNVEQIADYFNVPVEMAINRGRRLGILSWSNL